ncbi:MAG TPA: ADP-ribosylglycohydrolase family protein, partial [Thermoanaerobaculia bacterium]|nr:ADP-ribosylglycohydrolase family protein [Thermoanaerobaculia bacterium]
DTQLTLASCEAIIRAERIAPEDIAGRMLAWYRDRRITGIGSSTLKAMRDLEAGAHWALAGARGERAAGNGAAMRIAPVAFFLDPSVPAERTMIRDISRITHHNDEAYVGALAVVLAIRSAAARKLLPPAGIASFLPDSRVRDNLLKLPATTELELPELATLVGTSGFAAETVPFALAIVPRLIAHDFEATLHALNKVGGDTDTIGSIAGQVAGAYIGAADLPIGVLSGVPGTNELLAIAQEFAALGSGA